MQALSQSAFLQALGYAIANSLWQAAFLWVLVALCNSIKTLPSQVKYKVALAAQLGIFIWFVITLQFYYVKCSQAFAQYPGLNGGSTLVLHPGMQSLASAMLSVILKGEMLLPYLSIAYLCLLVALAVRWVKGYRQTQRIKTTGLQKIDVEWRLFVQKIGNLIGIKKPVGIYISQLVNSPLTIGFLKPLILIPLASINSLTTYQLEAVILHELAHIRRADYVINLVLTVIETALFFNPFTQLLSKMISRERENSCDDWVLQFQYDPSTYAEALLRIAYLQHTPALAMNAAAGKENDLLWRVKRMLNQQQRSFQYRNQLVSLVLITGMLSSVAWFRPAVKEAVAAKPAAQKNTPVVVEPMATQVNNPLFNPLSFLNKPLQAEVNKAVEDAKADLLVSTQLALDKTSDALGKVVPATLEGLKAANVDLPQIMSAAGTAANMSISNMDATGTGNIDLKGLKDSLNVGNIIKLALSEGLKSVDWGDVNTGLSVSQTALKQVLGSKGQRVVVDGNKIKNLVLKNLGNVANSIFKVNVAPGDDNTSSSGDEDGSDDAELTAPGGVTLKAHASKRAQNQKAHQKVLQVTRKTDSLGKVYSRLTSKNVSAAEMYTAIANQFDRQTDSSTNGYGYTTNYVPVKFDQNLPYNLTVGAANNVTVTSKGASTLIAVKEDTDNPEGYKKRITIETLDSTGQKHVYHVTFEMYQ